MPWTAFSKTRRYICICRDRERALEQAAVRSEETGDKFHVAQLTWEEILAALAAEKERPWTVDY